MNLFYKINTFNNQYTMINNNLLTTSFPTDDTAAYQEGWCTHLGHRLSLSKLNNV